MAAKGAGHALTQSPQPVNAVGTKRGLPRLTYDRTRSLANFGAPAEIEGSHRERTLRRILKDRPESESPTKIRCGKPRSRSLHFASEIRTHARPGGTPIL